MSKTVAIDKTKEFKGLRLIGGNPGLDFLNTVKYRGKTNDGDRFLEFSDILRWALLVQLIDQTEYKLLRGQNTSSESNIIFHRICEFREQTRLIIFNHELDEKKLGNSINFVEQTISKLRPKIHINRQTGVLDKKFPIKQPKDLFYRIVSCIDNLLQQREAITIKTCCGEDCDWVFADETKAKRRKWCDTRTCGNLARVRKHRATS